MDLLVLERLGSQVKWGGWRGFSAKGSRGRKSRKIAGGGAADHHIKVLA